MKLRCLTPWLAILFCLGTCVIAVAPPQALAAETLIERLLRISGLTANPSQMKGAGDAIDGDIWIADLKAQTATPLTHDGGYAWPVFAPSGDAVLALSLKDRQVVRILVPGGKVAPVQKTNQIVKLVGFDAKDPDQLLVVVDDSAVGSPLALVSLKTGKLEPLPYDRKSDVDRRMLNHIRGQERVFGGSSVYVKPETKRGMTREIEWTDVYVRRGEAPPKNVSNCDGVNCGQPSLSSDGSKVVFVKAAK